jgi:hypothetical protein
MAEDLERLRAKLDFLLSSKQPTSHEIKPAIREAQTLRNGSDFAPRLAHRERILAPACVRVIRFKQAIS